MAFTIIDIDNDGDHDVVFATDQGTVATLEPNSCYLVSTCIARGKCVTSGNGRRQCECYISAASGPQCQYCPSGTVEVKFKGGDAITNQRPLECIPCLAGQWSNISGNLGGKCTSCPRGRFNSNFASSSDAECFMCPRGFSSNISSASFCVNCVSGKFQNEEGATECNMCPVGWFQDGTNSTKCTSCSEGEYQNNKGTAFCLPCLPGFFNDIVGAVHCKVCDTGKFQGEPNGTTCYSVEAGSIVLGGGSASVPVPLGSKIDLLLTSGFVACSAGTIGTDPPTASCNSCPAGETSSPGAISCQDCNKGRFGVQSEGSGKCIDCPVGFFQDTAGQTTCTDCPRGWGAIQDENDGKGSPVCRNLNWKKPEDCTNDQYFDNQFLSNPSNWTCMTCPHGGACVGPITWHTLGPLFGWWEIPQHERPNEKTMFTKCLYPPACLGASNPELKNMHLDVRGKRDLALVGMKSGVNATNTTCAIELGFRNESRLCHTCNSRSRRKG